MIKLVMFDLGGTLMMSDEDFFTKMYFKLLTEKMSEQGYDPEELVNTIWTAVTAMAKSGGVIKNEKAFWASLESSLGSRLQADKKYFDEFYEKDFDKLACTGTEIQGASDVVKQVKAMGIKTALTTNPLFPSIAVCKRLSWAGCDESDFDHITSYENSSFIKPNPKYFLEVAQTLGVQASECLVVGNDTRDDMVAESVGMQVFLVNYNISNKNGDDISRYPQGGFDDLIAFIEKQNQSELF